MVLLIIYLLSSASLLGARYYGYVDWMWHAVSFPLWGPISMLLLLIVVNALPGWMLSMGYKVDPDADNLRGSLKFYHIWLGKIKVVNTLLRVTYKDSEHDALMEGFKLGYANDRKNPKRLRPRTIKHAVEKYEAKQMELLKKRLAKEMTVIDNG